MEQSGLWNFVHPVWRQNKDPIIPSQNDEFHLDPEFTIETISLVHSWWNYLGPFLESDQIDLRGNVYVRDGIEVPTEDIEGLIKSIRQLRPQPTMLNISTAFGSYPGWTIELVSSEGDRVLLNADSDGPFYAPWNIISHGQIYAQFSGEICIALDKLFEIGGFRRDSTEDPWEGEGYSVRSAGWPDQLSQGYSGLILLQPDFGYWIDQEAGEINGHIRGRYSIGGMGNTIVGSITELLAIIIDIPGGVSKYCPIEILPSDDPSSILWGFTCSVEFEDEGGTYQFPLKVIFKTDDNIRNTSSGELFGYLDQGLLLPTTSLPSEINSVLASSVTVEDLLRDHELFLFKSYSSVDPNVGLMDSHWNGVVVLLGQASIKGGEVIRYTVTLSVSVDERVLTKWDLDRQELNMLIQSTLDQEITQYFLGADPDLILNLYYLEGNKPYSRGMRSYPECGDSPAADGLPSDERPLRAFGFNQRWMFDYMQVIFVDGQLRIGSLRIHPNSLSDANWLALLPEELNPPGIPTFDYIRQEFWEPYVSVSWGGDQVEGIRSAYQGILKDWQGSREAHTWGVTFKPATIFVTDEGTLELVGCTETDD